MKTVIDDDLIPRSRGVTVMTTLLGVLVLALLFVGFWLAMDKDASVPSWAWFGGAALLGALLVAGVFAVYFAEMVTIGPEPDDEYEDPT